MWIYWTNQSYDLISRLYFTNCSTVQRILMDGFLVNLMITSSTILLSSPGGFEHCLFIYRAFSPLHFVYFHASSYYISAYDSCLIWHRPKIIWNNTNTIFWLLWFDQYMFIWATCEPIIPHQPKNSLILEEYELNII